VSAVPARHISVVAALAALTGLAAGAYRLHLLRRALDAERAARRLTDGLHHRDMDTFVSRLHHAVHAGAALREANTVLDTALHDHRHPEGGPTA
jgi:hypothetical protein